MSYKSDRTAEARKELLEFFREMMSKGYRCFINTSTDSVYGFIVLEHSVMDISLEYFGGWNYGLNYKPSAGNGSGCICKEIKLCDLSYETLRVHETACRSFAFSLRADMYPSVDACIKYLLDFYKTQYEEVTLEDK